jgi:hypothetical protein
MNKEFLNDIEGSFKKQFPNSYIETWHSKRFSETYNIHFSLGKDKTEYSHGIFENDPMAHKLLVFFQDNENKPLSLESGGGLSDKNYKTLTRIRKKQGTEEQILKHLDKYFIELKRLVIENNIK